MSNIPYYILFNDKGKQISMIASETDPSTEEQTWHKIPDKFLDSQCRPSAKYFCLENDQIVASELDSDRDEIMIQSCYHSKKIELENYAKNYRDNYYVTFQGREYDCLEKLRCYIMEQLLLSGKTEVTLFDRRKQADGSHEHKITAANARLLMESMILPSMREIKRAYDAKYLELQALNTITGINNFDVKFVVSA